MLILPIVNKHRVMNVELRLKYASKIRSRVFYEDAKESEIIVNREKFSESSFSKSREESAPTDFIRSKSILYPRKFLVTTKQATNSRFYDIYEVKQPPKKVNQGLDKLYGKAITDLRKEIPGETQRGRYVSFEELGIDKPLTDDKIALLQRIVREERDTSRWPSLFQKYGLSELSETLDFVNHFDCTVLSDHSIPETSLQDTLTAMEAIHTRDYKNLKKYYDTAKSNARIYTRISYIHKLLYDQPLSLIHAKQKQLVKTKDETDYQQAA